MVEIVLDNLDGIDDQALPVPQVVEHLILDLAINYKDPILNDLLQPILRQFKQSLEQVIEECMPMYQNFKDELVQVFHHVTDEFCRKTKEHIINLIDAETSVINYDNERFWEIRMNLTGRGDQITPQQLAEGALEIVLGGGVRNVAKGNTFSDTISRFQKMVTRPPPPDSAVPVLVMPVGRERAAFFLDMTQVG